MNHIQLGVSCSNMVMGDIEACMQQEVATSRAMLVGATKTVGPAMTKSWGAFLWSLWLELEV
jgi:hypothetical protein